MTDEAMPAWATEEQIDALMPDAARLLAMLVAAFRAEPWIEQGAMPSNFELTFVVRRAFEKDPFWQELDAPRLTPTTRS